MRHLGRPPVKLKTLGKAGAGGKKATQHLERWKVDPTTKFDFPDHWNKPDVRGALYAMHGRACAYCLSNLPNNDRGDVEHFRPKALYWWLAYEFTNYFLSCSSCNRMHKRERFPLAIGETPLTYEEWEEKHVEKFLLLDPADPADLVEDHIAIFLKNDLWLVEPGANLAPQSLLDLRVRTTIEFFDLDGSGGNWMLVKERTETIDRAMKALKAAKNGDDYRRVELQKMASRYQPHGASVRQMLARAAPQFLPLPAEEFAWLVKDLMEDLRIATALAEYSPKSQGLQRAIKELCWALAVLWKHPPTGPPSQVEAWLAAESWRDAVFDFCQKLPV